MDLCTSFVRKAEMDGDVLYRSQPVEMNITVESCERVEWYFRCHYPL